MKDTSIIDHTGRQLDKYRLLRLLERGGFADVYLAEHLYLQTLVAVKILHTQLDEKTIADFLKEAQTIAKLRNPHIVRVQDFGIDNTDNTLYLVMDYAPHGSLRTLHPHGSIVPLEKVVGYAQQVADALQHAHDDTTTTTARQSTQHQTRSRASYVASTSKGFDTKVC